MTIFDKIYIWNKDKNLLPKNKKVNLKNEISYIIEELIEMSNGITSEKARKKAFVVTEQILDKQYTPSTEEIIDAAGDIIIYATGIISKLGYDSNIVMEEIIKEIFDRQGSVDESGKWVKDRSHKNYTANFTKAKIRG